MKKKYCNNCKFLRLLPDPDPFDWFSDNDEQAICIRVNALITEGFEPSEVPKIYRPLYCPLLNRILNEDEKRKAQENLQFARKRLRDKFN